MTSMQYSVCDTDFTFLYDNPQKKKNETLKDTILYILENEPRLTLFRYLVKVAGMDDFFNSTSTSVTVFIPTDELITEYENTILNIDPNTARKIVNFSTVPKKISKNGLRNGMYYLHTKSDGNRLLVDSTSEEIILNKNTSSQVNVVATNISAINGYIHITNGLLIPQSVY